MMIRTYQLGRTVFAVESRFPFTESEHYSAFVYNGPEKPEFVIRVAVEHEYPDMKQDCISLALTEIEREYLSARVIFKKANVPGLLLQRGSFALHASYVVRNGRAILFTAPSGTGKSTQAEFWHRCRNAEIVNGDRTLITESDDGFRAGGFYLCGTSGICKNITAPIAAVVVLGQSKENQVRRVGAIEAFKSILSQSHYHVDDSGEVTAVTGLVSRLVSAVPVWKLDCINDPSAVDELEKYL